MTTTRRLAAILAADVAGYSRLMGADEEGTLAALNVVRRELLDPKLAEFGGRLFKTTGDGFLVEFVSVVQAMRCAVEMQQAMTERNRPIPESERLQFRMGITLGDVIVEGDDIFGDGVNIAARLEQLATPGGICISNRVYEDVRDRLAIGLQDGGEHQLKNITRPVRVWHWLTGGANRLAADSTGFNWGTQQIKHCRTQDGVRLAYSIIGEGPPLVKAGGFLSHLQHEVPVWGPGFLRLAKGRSLIRYDARGNGLSDWEVGDLSQEAWVTDLETIIDAVGLKRFGLIGFSQGCATSIAYAVRHPEKVSHLVLYGGFARGGLGSGDAEKREGTLAQATLMRMGWSSPNPAYRQIYATRMLPDMTKAQAVDFDRLLRETSSGDVAARYLVAAAEIDVTNLLAQVRVPTLVMHMRDDAVVPFEAGKKMAAGIPGARFVGISGRSHVPLPGDPASERGFEEIDLFLKQSDNNQSATKISSERSELLALPDKPSIAVLPFQNMSGDPEQEYFADGIVEDITTALSHFKSLFVIARNSSFTFKGKAIDIRQVGDQLGVRYILEGSVRRSGNRIRITGQLIEAATVTHLWADKFEGTLDDIFRLQDQVTSGVVGVVAPTIEQAEIERAKRKPTANLQAYDYYLRGIARVDRLTREDNEEALRLFLKAIEIDPGFSAAMAHACLCYSQRLYQGWLTDKENDIAQALRWAKTSLEVGKDDAHVLATAALTLGFFPNDTSIEFRHALSEQALRLNPNLGIAWYRSGYDKIFQGDHGLAITHFLRALQLNPLDRYSLRAYTYMTGLAAAYFFNGQNEEAERWAQRSLDGNPSFLPTLRLMVAIKAALSKDADTKQCARRLLEINPAETIGDTPTYKQLSRLEDRLKWFEALQSAGIPA